MASNSFLRMLFGNSTEPSYAGIRVPRLYSGDDAVLTRQVSPQERYRQYNGASRTEAEQRRLDQVLEDKEAEAPRNGKLQGAIQGLGGSLAEIFAQNDQQQSLSLPPVMMGEQIPIIDPRYMRYAGSRKKGGSVPVGSYVKVHDDEKVLNLGDGDVEVVPKGDEPKIQTLGGTIEVPIEETQESFKPPQKEDTSHSMGTPQEMEEPVKQSIADTLRGQVDDIQRRLAKGATKNPDGTTTYGDKQYRKRNALDVLKSAGLGVLQSLASAPPTNDLGALLGRAIGGGAAGGVMGATMNNADEKMQDRMKLAQLLPQYQQAYGMERQKQADDDQARIRDTQIRNYEEDNRNAKWGRQIQEKELTERQLSRVAREQTSRMNAVAGLLKNAPEFIPGDPKYKELEQALGDVKLPVFTKDAKKKVDLKQDQRTGAWTVILTNPVTGQQEVRPVMQDGKPLKTTPTVVMQGEYGMLRQNDAQAFTQSENEKNRQLRVQLQQNAQQYGRDKTIQMATDAFKRLFQKENGTLPTQAEIDTYLGTYVDPFLGVNATGEIVP